MRDSTIELRALIERATELRAEANAIAQDARMLNPRLAAGRTALRILDVGGRRDLVSLGRLFGEGNLIARRNALIRSFEQWYGDANRFLRTVSVDRKGLTARGNSSTLTKRLARAKKYKRLDTRIGHAIGELESVLEDELVYNNEIPEFLVEQRRRTKEERRRFKEAEMLDLSKTLPGMESTKLENRERLREHFRGHPAVAQMIEGALDVFASTGADAKRQALASCRSALEQAVFEVTGTRRFREGLANLAAGTRRKLVGGTYDFLSGYGSHSGGTPAKKDVAYGIRMTIASCTWILDQTG